jgi:hypothetical protein
MAIYDFIDNTTNIRRSRKTYLIFMPHFLIMNKQMLFAVIPVLGFLLIGSSIAAATPLSNQSGTISSTQNGPDGKPAWKVSGTWNFINLKSNTPTFNASVDMMKLDGSSVHKHAITATLTSADLKLHGKTSTRIYSGIGTISMKEGSVSNVPVTIKLSSDNRMSIMLDPIKTTNHFGNTPIQVTGKGL